jgi:hypothetical protein
MIALKMGSDCEQIDCKGTKTRGKPTKGSICPTYRAGQHPQGKKMKRTDALALIHLRMGL